MPNQSAESRKISALLSRDLGWNSAGADTASMARF
jgi:hypothetical protein